MKTLKRTSIISLIVLFTFSVFAEKKDKKKKTATLTFKVEGVCDMCKKRIEDAALIKGVKMAQWDKETQKLQVIYRPEKTNQTTIHKAVAHAGHDTEKVKAPDKVYDKLHHCCKYRDGVKPH